MIDPADLIAALRKRPGMAVGDTASGEGLRRLVCSVIDDAVADRRSDCSRIDVRVHADNSITVVDDGRDNVVGMEELVAFRTHARPDRIVSRCTPWTGYMGGMFIDGGAIVANALSEHLRFEIHDNGKAFAQEYEKGRPVTELAERTVADGRRTSITFRPDPEVFATIDVSFEQIADRLRDLAFVHRGLRATLHDDRADREVVFTFPDGIASCLSGLTAGATALSEVIKFSAVAGSREGVDVDIAMQWTDRPSESIVCFANSKRNRLGGTHAQGFLRALKETAKRNGVAARQLLAGLTAVISIRFFDPMFSNAGYDQLRSPDVEAVVAAVVVGMLGEYLERHPDLVSRLAWRRSS
jgi:DNA gyrase subunit B